MNFQQTIFFFFTFSSFRFKHLPTTFEIRWRVCMCVGYRDSGCFVGGVCSSEARIFYSNESFELTKCRQFKKDTIEITRYIYWMIYFRKQSPHAKTTLGGRFFDDNLLYCLRFFCLSNPYLIRVDVYRNGCEKIKWKKKGIRHTNKVLVRQSFRLKISYFFI